VVRGMGLGAFSLAVGLCLFDFLWGAMWYALCVKKEIKGGCIK